MKFKYKVSHLTKDLSLSLRYPSWFEYFIGEKGLVEGEDYIKVTDRDSQAILWEYYVTNPVRLLIELHYRRGFLTLFTIDSLKLYSNLNIKTEYKAWINKYIGDLNLRDGVDYRFDSKEEWIKTEDGLNIVARVERYYITKSVEEYIKKSETLPEVIDNKFPVNTREIWELLGIKKHYREWIKYYIRKFEWAENVDYIKAPKKWASSKTGQISNVYFITVQASLQLRLTVSPDRLKVVKLISEFMANGMTFEDVSNALTLKAKELV